ATYSTRLYMPLHPPGLEITHQRASWGKWGESRAGFVSAIAPTYSAASFGVSLDLLQNCKAFEFGMSEIKRLVDTRAFMGLASCRRPRPLVEMLFRAPQ